MDNRLEGLRRYQPQKLIKYMGYDREVLYWIDIELAKLEVDAELGRIPPEIYALLDDTVIEKIYQITMSMVDEYEREFTKHDVRALVLCILENLPDDLKPYVHHPMTSFDVRDTAMALEFKKVFEEVIERSIRRFLLILAKRVKELAYQPQIGRTHGQHAIPITVGFWLANFLYRGFYCLVEMRHYKCGLRGKISGAVGAYNAQEAFGIYKTGKGRYEDLVLEKLGLKASQISSQIVPPEPIANFLHSFVLFSGMLGNLGRDVRNLSRTEIKEVFEPFSKTQTGSSAMPHKRNPIISENAEGLSKIIKNNYFNVLDNLISEHQRDLTGSAISRTFGSIIVLFQKQLNNWLRKDQQGKTYLERLVINKEALERNLKMSSHVYMSELLWPALSMAGLENAHDYVNHSLVPQANSEFPLIDVLFKEAEKNEELSSIINKIPDKILNLMREPDKYVGRAAEKALEIVNLVEELNIS